MIDGGFVEREVLECGLVINRSGVHGFCEFHDRIAKIGVAGEDGGLDWGGAAEFGQEGRVKIDDSLGLKKF